MVTSTFGFLDTNIFLHFPPIDQIDWPNLLCTRKTILVVTSVVIRELNRHKDAPVSTKLRDRAASMLRRLHGYSEQQGVIAVRDNVELLFHAREPLVTFASEGLAREVPDDYLIATMLEFRRESPQLDVVLITDDLGLKLKARAYGIRTFGPPEHMRLPDEPDPNQKRIRELEERVRQLQLQVPDLKLVFLPGKDQLHFELKPEVILSPKVLSWRLGRLRKKFPKMPKPVLSGAELQAGAIPPEAFDGYNEQLDRFFSNYEAYLAHLQNHLNQKRRIVGLDIWAWNTGSCPARDTDIFLHFPEDVAVLVRSTLPSRPNMPHLPAKPKPRAEARADAWPAVTLNPNILNQAYVMGGASFQPLVSGVEVLSGLGSTTSRAIVDGNQVRMHIEQAKHKLMTSVDTIYVMFKSHAQAHSFTVDYDILCANIPDKQTGQLHVIVERRA